MANRQVSNTNAVLENPEPGINSSERKMEHLMLMEADKNKEIDRLAAEIQAQEKNIEELRKNRSQIILDQNLLKKKIMEERAGRENFLQMAEQIKETVADIKQQISAASLNLDKMEEYNGHIDRYIEMKDNGKVKYMTTALQAEEQYRLLNMSIEKARLKMKEDLDGLKNDLFHEVENLSLEKTEINELIESMMKSNKYLCGNEVWKESAGKTDSMMDCLSLLRKTCSLLTGKNKSLKINKLKNEEDMRKTQEEIIKFKEEISEMNNDVLSCQEKLMLDKESEKNLVEQLARTNAELSDIASKTSALELQITEDEQKWQKTNELKKILLSQEMEVSEKLNLMKDRYENQINELQVNLAIIQEEIAKLEPERYLLAGRIFEAEQQSNILSEEVNCKTEELKALELKTNELEEDVRKIKKEREDTSMVEKQEFENLSAKLEKLRLENKVAEQEMAKHTEKKLELLNKLNELTELLNVKQTENKAKEDLIAETTEKIENARKEHTEKSEEVSNMNDGLQYLKKRQDKFDEGNAVQTMHKQNFDRITLEIDNFETETFKKMEGMMKHLESLKVSVQHKENEMEELQKSIAEKIELTEKNNEEILKLKQLLRESDAELARELKQKECQEKQLVNKREARKKIQEEEEERMRQNEEAKKLEQKRKEEEEAARQKLIEEANLKKQEAKKEEVAKSLAIKRGAVEKKTNLKGNKTEMEANYKWMEFIEQTGVKIKEEKMDLIELGSSPVEPVVQKAASDGKKKFFKTRNEGEKRVPVYAAAFRNNKPKKPVEADNAFDYESDDSIKVIYTGPPRKGRKLFKK